MKKILNEEQILKKYIKKLVKESLNDINENYYNESFYMEGNDDADYDNDNSSKGDKKEVKRKIHIQDFFSQDGVNPAAYAYKLFSVKSIEGKDTNEMKNARSLFMKKLHNEKNQDGSTYDFTSDEVNRLYSMISSNELSESKKIRLSENQFKQIIMESVKKVLNNCNFY